MKTQFTHSTPSPSIRDLIPIARTSEDVNGVVVKCAREFAKSFAKNPSNPRLRAIAKEVGCSRNAVKTHLIEAQKKNLLVLTLRLPKDETLSERLARKYGLVEAVVSLTPASWGDQHSVRTALAPEVMHYVENACIRLAEARGEQSPVGIGFDGGLTLYRAVHNTLAQEFPAKLRYELVPLVFGPLGGSKYTATVVANLLASKLESLGLNVEVPDAFAIKVENGKVRGDDNDHRIKFTINMHDRALVSRLDLFVVGIGSHRAGLFHREMQLNQANVRSTREYFGDILNLPFDRSGDEVASLSRGRATLLSLKELHEMAMSSSTLVVGTAGGKDKIDAIQTVLERKYISVLVTDAETASALLEG